MATYFNFGGFPFPGGSASAGYILHAFIAGGTTPTAMFTNSSGTSAGTTVTLDSNGYPSTSGTVHPIWLDTSVSYDLELRDTGDVTVVWSAENISATTASGGVAIAQVNGITALRGLTAGGDTVFLNYQSSANDGGHGFYQYFSGASAGTYVDDGLSIIVPTGGDGSAAWISLHNSGVYPVTAGTGSAYTVDAFPSTPVSGVYYGARIHTANLGGALTIDSISVKNLSDGLDPIKGSMPQNHLAIFHYDGVNYLYVNPVQLFDYYLLTAAAYQNKKFNASSQLSGISEIVFKPDGTSMYLTSTVDDVIYQYTLTDPFNIDTASYASKSYNPGTESTNVQALEFSADGTKFFVGSLTPNGIIYQYSMTTAWDVSTASYDSKSFSVLTQETALRAINFSSDGTTMLMAGANSNTLYEYTLSTAWDISTASYASNSFDLATPTDLTVLGSFHVSNDGKLLFVMSFNPASEVFQYRMTTGWDVSTCEDEDLSLDVSNFFGGSAEAIAFDDVGSRMYINTSDRIIKQFLVQLPRA